jgi:hypothetical protein
VPLAFHSLLGSSSTTTWSPWTARLRATIPDTSISPLLPAFSLYRKERNASKKRNPYFILFERLM